MRPPSLLKTFPNNPARLSQLLRPLQGGHNQTPRVVLEIQLILESIARQRSAKQYLTQQCLQVSRWMSLRQLAQQQGTLLLPQASPKLLEVLVALQLLRQGTVLQRLQKSPLRPQKPLEVPQAKSAWPHQQPQSPQEARNQMLPELLELRLVLQQLLGMKV